MARVRLGVVILLSGLNFEQLSEDGAEEMDDIGSRRLGVTFSDEGDLVLGNETDLVLGRTSDNKKDLKLGEEGD